MTDYRLYIHHMLECIDAVERYTLDGQHLFFTDDKTQNAVYRKLEILGEAAKRIPLEIRQLAPDIPWRRIAGLRDVLIHQYDGIDPREIWIAVQRDMPSLKVSLQSLLTRLSSAE